jgi:endonuclease-3
MAPCADHNPLWDHRTVIRETKGRTTPSATASEGQTGAKATGAKATGAKQARPKRRRARPDPVRTWIRALDRKRPGLVRDTLAALAAMYGPRQWQRRNDPTSELILTILSANSSDINAEYAFELLRRRYPSGPTTGPTPTKDAPRPDDRNAPKPPPGWGGRTGIGTDAPPDWAAVEFAPLDELIDAIRPGGLGPQKAPRIQAALRALREARGDYSLEFLGDMSALEARAWLTAIPGIGRKTASVVLLFCFGMPLMPVDRHVERVAKRIGVLPPKADADLAHELFLGMLEPDQMYEAHVNLITHGRETCHAQRPDHERCAIAYRCRYVDPKAP